MPSRSWRRRAASRASSSVSKLRRRLRGCSTASASASAGWEVLALPFPRPRPWPRPRGLPFPRPRPRCTGGSSGCGGSTKPVSAASGGVAVITAGASGSVGRKGARSIHGPRQPCRACRHIPKQWPLAYLPLGRQRQSVQLQRLRHPRWQLPQSPPARRQASQRPTADVGREPPGGRRLVGKREAKGHVRRALQPCRHGRGMQADYSVPYRTDGHTTQGPQRWHVTSAWGLLWPASGCGSGLAGPAGAAGIPVEPASGDWVD